MLLSRRSLFALCAAFTVAACGFEPTYKTGSAARSVHGDIEINLIESIDGFALLQELEALIGAGGPQSTYVLDAGILTTQSELIIDTATAVTRITLFGKSNFKVTRRSDKEVVYSGDVETEVAFSQTSTAVASDSARRDAHRRLMTNLAAAIAAELEATAQSWTR